MSFPDVIAYQTYSKALSAYSAAVQLYACSEQLNSCITLSARLKDSHLPWCRFGCTCSPLVRRVLQVLHTVDPLSTVSPWLNSRHLAVTHSFPWRPVVYLWSSPTRRLVHKFSNLAFQLHRILSWHPPSICLELAPEFFVRSDQVRPGPEWHN
jgi:hypothetical protein